MEVKFLFLPPSKVRHGDAVAKSAGITKKVAADAGFDAFVEAACKPYYAAKMGAPSVPPGRYFRMHMVGYFEGLDERGSSGAVKPASARVEGCLAR